MCELICCSNCFLLPMAVGMNEIGFMKNSRIFVWYTRSGCTYICCKCLLHSQNYSLVCIFESSGHNFYFHRNSLDTLGRLQSYELSIKSLILQSTEETIHFISLPFFPCSREEYNFPFLNLLQT